MASSATNASCEWLLGTTLVWRQKSGLECFERPRKSFKWNCNYIFHFAITLLKIVVYFSPSLLGDILQPIYIYIMKSYVSFSHSFQLLSELMQCLICMIHFYIFQSMIMSSIKKKSSFLQGDANLTTNTANSTPLKTSTF